MNTKILLFGSTGQIGSAILELFPKDYDLLALSRCNDESLCGDIENFEGIKETINHFKPDIIINAAALTKVDLCEIESDKANVINSLAVKNIAEAAKKINSFFIHYSTDYVFNGLKSSPIKEDDLPNPINVYGKSKLDGELAIVLSNCNHAIIRTSWVYSNLGENFLLTVLNLSSKNNSIKVVNDQFGSPTSAKEIANFTLHVVIDYLDKKKYSTNINNIYHFTSDGITSWYEFAVFIARKAVTYGIDIDFREKDIIAITSKEYKTKAKRPKYSKLDNAFVKEKFGIKISHWRYNVEQTIKSL